MSKARSARYRRLARMEADKTKAALLLKLADECDEGRLCVAQWHSARPAHMEELPPTELAFKPWWRNGR
jgi:hypothetical protein